MASISFKGRSAQGFKSQSRIVLSAEAVRAFFPLGLGVPN